VSLIDSNADRLAWLMMLQLVRRTILRMEVQINVALAAGPTQRQLQILADADMWLGTAANALTAAENEVRKLP
jgi:hypothetical protein